MFHTVMARELGHKSNVKILNYAPGMVETDMSASPAACNTLDSEINYSFKKSFKEKTMVKPSATAETLLNLILSEQFESMENGSHVDYLDLI